MVVIYSNDIWTLTISNDDTSTTGTGTVGLSSETRKAINPHRWMTESRAPIPCPPPEYCNPQAQWNAEKRRRQIAGIKAAQQKHARIKLSACKTSRKVLKYYREPNLKWRLKNERHTEN